MADVIRKVISGNSIRHGDPVTSADKKGNYSTFSRAITNGALCSETRLTDRLKKWRGYTPHVGTLTLTTAGTVYTWTPPEGTKKYAFHCRTTTPTVKHSYTNGDIAAGNYETLFPGVAFETPDNFEPLVNETLYLSSDTDTTVIEFTYWQ